MSLQNTIKELKRLKPFTEENVEEGPIETLNGRRGRKTQAIEQTKVLKRQYSLDLLSSAVFIIVTGSKRDEYEKIAIGKKFKLFSADPEEFYKDLANRVSPSLYSGRASPTDLFDVIGRHLEDKMNELEVNEYNQMTFRDKYVQVINTPAEFVTLLKTAINEQIGSEVVGIQAVRSIADKAIEVGHATQTTPIVLNTRDPKLAASLARDLKRLTSQVYLVTVGEGPKYEEALNLEDSSAESVKVTLDHIKTEMKEGR